ncbi:uncharacterized protein FMAN_13227 [Fusarium mangiferae]|uniref:Uncharacterized protein n=1 Tax=Fusarium mangiferae TaxID=192010 RepID=A0A1L7TAK2_FUSMA|nr:uncharacterized protein FMAN_13227 [Fusarium mangiferae]CVK94959.1 uncharacterized protein FMAN_13227 [Fusarium mangiferae]
MPRPSDTFNSSFCNRSFLGHDSYFISHGSECVFGTTSLYRPLTYSTNVLIHPQKTLQQPASWPFDQEQGPAPPTGSHLLHHNISLFIEHLHTRLGFGPVTQQTNSRPYFGAQSPMATTPETIVATMAAISRTILGDADDGALVQQQQP